MSMRKLLLVAALVAGCQLMLGCHGSDNTTSGSDDCTVGSQIGDRRCSPSNPAEVQMCSSTGLWENETNCATNAGTPTCCQNGSTASCCATP